MGKIETVTMPPQKNKLKEAVCFYIPFTELKKSQVIIGDISLVKVIACPLKLQMRFV